VCILNKQSRTADKRRSSSMGIGHGADKSSQFNVLACYEIIHRTSESDAFLELPRQRILMGCVWTGFTSLSTAGSC
jgi:hypothetical protein